MTTPSPTQVPHTPTPWQATSAHSIGTDDELIAHVYAQRNVAPIIEAVNSHAALLSRVRELEGALRTLLGQVLNIEVLGELSAMDTNHSQQKRMRDHIDEVVKAARAALSHGSEEGK
jgi:hypothetical protein